MENKLTQLEAQKAELEKAHEAKTAYAQLLASDIALMEQLIVTKREHRKVLNEINEMAQLHGKVCAEIEAAKTVEEVKEGMPEV